MNLALFRLALRRLLLRRRSVLLALAPLLAALVAAIDAGEGTADAQSFADLMEALFLPTILPFLALVIGASALGEERDDATILYLASTPLSAARDRAPGARRRGAHDHRRLPAGAPDRDRARARRRREPLDHRLGARLRRRRRLHLHGAFGALSLLVKRPVVIGLIYVLFWEGSIGTFAPSARWFSLGAYARAVTAGGLPSSTDTNVPAIGAAAAFAVLAAVAAVTTWWCGRRLTRVELP